MITVLTDLGVSSGTRANSGPATGITICPMERATYVYIRLGEIRKKGSSIVAECFLCCTLLPVSMLPRPRSAGANHKATNYIVWITRPVIDIIKSGNNEKEKEMHVCTLADMLQRGNIRIV